MTSIRTFLVVAILSVICLSNFIAALQGYRDSLNAADKIEEKQLLEKIHMLSALIENKSAIPDRLFRGNILFQVWHHGRLVIKSDNSPETVFHNPDAEFHLKSYGGHQWLVYGKPGEESGFDIIVALERRAYSTLAEGILIRAILPIIWALPIIGILVWFVVNTGMKPLKRLAATLSNKKPNDFSPIKAEHYAGELLPIVDALNGLLHRLSQTFERERRFSADAAHELRTPLSALKINLHNLTQEYGEVETFQAVKRTAERMEHSIEQLLELHRVSFDTDDSQLGICHLNRLAQEVVAEVYDTIAIKQQTIELLGTDVNVRGNALSMHILLRNLIENASKYSPYKGIIHVTMSQQHGCSIILIEDSGPGIPEEEYTRVLERFYRVDGNRKNFGIAGSGLGLSIVSHIIQMSGGQMRFSKSVTLGGLAVEVSLPSTNNESNDEKLA